MAATFSERDGTTAERCSTNKPHPELKDKEMEYDPSNRAPSFERQINDQRSRPISASGILQFALQSEI
jgi:hypothetical protein